MSVPPSRDDSIARPECCRECRHPTMHVHSYYWRRVARVLVRRFRCAACLATVLVLPRQCLHSVQHATENISSALAQMRERGARTIAAELGVAVRTLYRWSARFTGTPFMVITNLL